MAVKMVDAVGLLGLSQAFSGTINALQSIALYHYGYTRPTQDHKKAHILSLPSKIICQILKGSLEPDNDSEDFLPCHYPVVSESCRRSPIALSHVCAEWKHIVDSSPELWNTITFIHPSHRQLEPTAHWLSRLGDKTPLTISLYQFADQYGLGNDDSLGPLLNLLMTKAHLWHTIDFRLNGTVKADVMETLARIQMTHNPMLHIARVSIEPSNSASSSNVFPIFKAWDALRKVPTLSAFCWRAPFTPGTNYVSHLRVLEINSPISVEVLMENLKSCPLLEILNVDRLELESDSLESDPIEVDTADLEQHMVDSDRESWAMDWDTYCEPTPFIYLPRLLHIHLNTQVRLCGLLGRLHAPSLHILQIAGLDVRDRYLVIDMLQRNDHILSNLGLQFVSSTPQNDDDMPLSAAETKEYMNDLYPFIEQVRSLHLLGGTFDFSLIKVFARPVTREMECEDVFPELKSLGISKVGADVDEGVVLRMLGSRFWDFRYLTNKDHDDDGGGGGGALLETAKIHVDEVTDEMEKYVNMISRCGRSDGIERMLEMYST